jgi:hypothetical protein
VAIPSETIEQIAAVNDIVEVIGSYFPLKRAGANFMALCPFHQEKTPSFMVSPSRQTFHCFGLLVSSLRAALSKRRTTIKHQASIPELRMIGFAAVSCFPSATTLAK